MNFVAIKAPTTGVALAGKLFEFFDAALRIVAICDSLQIIADELVQAFAQCFGLLARAGHELFVQ